MQQVLWERDFLSNHDHPDYRNGKLQKVLTQFPLIVWHYQNGFFHLYNEYVPYIRSYKHIDYNDYTGKGHHFGFLEVDTLKIQYFYNLDTKNSQRQLDLAPGFCVISVNMVFLYANCFN